MMSGRFETGLPERVYDDVAKLVAVMEKKRADGATLVLANGCFDLIHVGHVRYLTEAADYGDLLVVAVNDDDSTRRLKGEGRPVMPERERAEIVASLRPVDYVLLFEEDTVDDVLIEIRPDVHAKGTDYEVDTVPELDTAKEIGCRTVITGDPKDHSSRSIIGGLRGKA